MRTPKDFDYDLWTSDDGKCYARVKETGEATEVSSEVMKLLRSEEKRVRRDTQPIDGTDKVLGSLAAQAQRIKHPLSLDANASASDSEGQSWLAVLDSMEDSVALSMEVDRFLHTLTPVQRRVYQLHVVEGYSISECAGFCGVAYQTIQDTVRLIRKKAKIFF